MQADRTWAPKNKAFKAYGPSEFKKQKLAQEENSVEEITQAALATNFVA